MEAGGLEQPGGGVGDSVLYCKQVTVLVVHAPVSAANPARNPSLSLQLSQSPSQSQQLLQLSSKLTLQVRVSLSSTSTSRAPASSLPATPSPSPSTSAAVYSPTISSITPTTNNALSYLSPHQQHRTLDVRLTDDSDPYFLHHLSIGEEDFHILRSEQSLLVDFEQFPVKFVELLDECVKSSGGTGVENEFVGGGGISTGGGPKYVNYFCL